MGPILEYGCAVWDPHHETDIENLEKIQKRAARFITGNYNFEHGSTKYNMKELNFKPLKERRAIIKLNIFYKGINRLIDIPTDHLRKNPRKCNNYAIPASNIDSHLYSFYPNTVRLWNSLPGEGKNLPSVDSFKNHLHKLTIRCEY